MFVTKKQFEEYQAHIGKRINAHENYDEEMKCDVVEDLIDLSKKIDAIVQYLNLNLIKTKEVVTNWGEDEIVTKYKVEIPSFTKESLNKRADDIICADCAFENQFKDCECDCADYDESELETRVGELETDLEMSDDYAFKLNDRIGDLEESLSDLILQVEELNKKPTKKNGKNSK